MGNRSKFVALTAAASGPVLVAARRRARLRRIAEGLRETILPTHVQDPPTDPGPEASEAHAPGHQHLPMADDEPAPRRLRGRPWTKHAHGMRHPFSGD